MSDGEGCKCAAHSRANCCCDVDWRFERESLKRQNVRLRKALKGILPAFCDRSDMETVLYIYSDNIDMLEAIARGWCHDDNKHKTMDSKLATAICGEVMKVVSGLQRENERLRKHLKTVRVVVDSQAKDEGIWFVAETAPEAYLQTELRKLHEALEAEDD